MRGVLESSAEGWIKKNPTDFSRGRFSVANKNKDYPCGLACFPSVSGRPLFEFLLDTGAIRRQLAGAAPDFKLESGIEPAFGIFSHI